MICGLDAVLQGQHKRMRPEHRPNRRSGVAHLPCLYRENNQVHLADSGKIVRRPGRGYHEIAQNAVYSQAMCSDGLEVGATRHENDILSGPSEPSSKVAAYSAGAEYRDTHRVT